MKIKNEIKPILEIIRRNKIDLPDSPGLYAFWWIGNKEILLNSQREFILAGPGGIDVNITLNDWWPKDLKNPCLYIGKSTNLRKRFSQHLLRKSYGRVHEIGGDGRKIKPHTTSCQLRYGIEHIFRYEQDPLDLIYKNIGYSFQTEFDSDPVIERFYEEDRLIGTWRPWFNVDSER